MYEKNIIIVVLTFSVLLCGCGTDTQCENCLEYHNYEDMIWIEEEVMVCEDCGQLFHKCNICGEKVLGFDSDYCVCNSCLEDIPTCINCWKYIYGTEVHLVNGEIYCSDCLVHGNVFRCCSNCGEYYSEDRIYETGDFTCLYCFKGDREIVSCGYRGEYFFDTETIIDNDGYHMCVNCQNDN